MNKHSAESGRSASDDPLNPAKPVLSKASLARRRVLLKGASRGAASLAVLQPLGALATGQSTVLTCLNAQAKETLCTISGVQSAAHSFGPTITKIPAKGKKMSWWAANTGGVPTNTWPSSVSTTCTPSKAVGTLFSGCANSGRSMMTILNSYATTIEADYVCAYLNAAAMYSASGPTTTMCFPYSPAQVQAFWAAGGTTRTNAQALFKAIATA